MLTLNGTTTPSSLGRCGHLRVTLSHARVRVSKTKMSEKISWLAEPPVTHILLPKTVAAWYARPWANGTGSKPVSHLCNWVSKRKRSL